MSILGKFGLMTDDEAADLQRRVRERRVEVARENPAWIEIAPLTRLVRRGPGGGMLVDSETDQVFRVFCGGVFAPKSASVEFVDHDRPLAFAVDRAGEVVFFEQVAESWTAIVERRARKAARAAS